MKHYGRYWASFGTIEKAETQANGDLLIAGIASGPERDADGEMIDPAGLEVAWQRFFAEGGGSGPLRVMHQPIAAGRVIEAKVDRAGYSRVRAVVVDSETKEKVAKGVLPCLSVGGRVLERDRQDTNVIRRLSLTELSLVDRGAHPKAKLSEIKEALARADLKRGDIDDEPEAVCGVCGAPCGVCAGEGEDAIEAVAGGRRARNEAEAIRKMAVIARERDGLIAKVAALESELRQRPPKGAVRALPVVVEKWADVGAPPEGPEAKADLGLTPVDLIKRIHGG